MGISAIFSLRVCNIFQEKAFVLKGPEARKVIRAYNKTAQVLLEYEILYHRAWVKSVEVVNQGKPFIG